MKLISIDPSIATIGISLWENRHAILAGTIVMKNRWTSDGPNKWLDELGTIVDHIILKNKFTGIDKAMLVMETPDFHFVDKNKKIINELRETVGLLQGFFYNRCGQIIRLPVSKWKGNSAKEETKILVKYEYKHIEPIVWELYKDGAISERTTTDSKLISDRDDSIGMVHSLLSEMIMKGEV
jgi:hypothetical protein